MLSISPKNIFISYSIPCWCYPIAITICSIQCIIEYLNSQILKKLCIQHYSHDESDRQLGCKMAKNKWEFLISFYTIAKRKFIRHYFFRYRRYGSGLLRYLGHRTTSNKYYQGFESYDGNCIQVSWYKSKINGLNLIKEVWSLKFYSQFKLVLDMFRKWECVRDCSMEILIVNICNKIWLKKMLIFLMCCNYPCSLLPWQNEGTNLTPSKDS